MIAVRHNWYATVTNKADPRAMHLEFTASRLTKAPEQIATSEFQMDEAAFRALYEETARPLFAYLLRVSGNRELAEDLLQEAYCRLLTTNLPPMEDHSKRSYLFRIATNLLHDYWRRHKEYPLPESVLENISTAPHPDLKIEMRQAFKHLKGRERSLLWLAYVEGLNHKEIAESTGLRAGSIKSLLFRARRKLTDLIERNGYRTKGDV
ncbi:MAG TPA: RNA polymerase sigma factor [Terriglobales bacterium]|jgi:RNA polymerase sigma-70 factor (ECF subfamily)